MRISATICYSMAHKCVLTSTCTTTIFTVFDLADLRMNLMYDTSAAGLLDTVLQSPDRHVEKMSSNTYCVQGDHLLLVQHTTRKYSPYEEA